MYVYDRYIHECVYDTYMSVCVCARARTCRTVNPGSRWWEIPPANIWQWPEEFFFYCYDWGVGYGNGGKWSELRYILQVDVIESVDR